MKSLLLALTVLLATEGSFVAAEDGDKLEAFQSPSCQDMSSLIDVATCISDTTTDYSVCFGEGTNTTVSSLTTCLTDGFQSITTNSNFFQDLTDLVTDCFDPMISCVKQRYEELIDSIHPCVNETMTALAQCAVDNAETCEASCADVQRNNWTDLIDKATTFDECPSIQTSIMDPFCTNVGCCPQCLDEVEALGECIVNNVVESTPQPCDFVCTARRRSRRLDASHASTVDADVLTKRCIEKTPGVLPSQDAATALAQNIDYFGCVEGIYLDVQDGKITDDSDAGNTGSTSDDGNTGGNSDDGGTGGDTDASTEGEKKDGDDSEAAFLRSTIVGAFVAAMIATSFIL
uniref:Uncharacterized protein n=1 Tax=Craspedostauros australis TaxID=1486917 RepID=A0A7R9WWD9_9STRA